MNYKHLPLIANLAIVALLAIGAWRFKVMTTPERLPAATIQGSGRVR